MHITFTQNMVFLNAYSQVSYKKNSYAIYLLNKINLSIFQSIRVNQILSELTKRLTLLFFVNFISKGNISLFLFIYFLVVAIEKKHAFCKHKYSSTYSSMKAYLKMSQYSIFYIIKPLVPKIFCHPVPYVQCRMQMLENIIYVGENYIGTPKLRNNYNFSNFWITINAVRSSSERCL